MHSFLGKWITDDEFFSLEPRNVFHRQLDKQDLPCDEHRNRHILFRKAFELTEAPKTARIFITADDYYKLYINAQFVSQGPAPSYHFQYNYNTIDVTEYLQPGENLIAVHTLYQGLINRVWQSGDNRHGMIFDLVCDGKIQACSDETVKTKPHSGYREIGTVGYKTQFMEEYNSNSAEVGFQMPGFDDSGWEYARIHRFDDHVLVPQTSKMLEFERIDPIKTTCADDTILYDFGSCYVGYLECAIQGKRGDRVTVRCGQELNDDGSLRYQIRANCQYEETWILNGDTSVLDQFDYKAFRYAELQLPKCCRVENVSFHVRHYPFTLQTEMRPEYRQNEDLKRIWELCVHTQKYGVQEVIQDCMDREKGFYLGDGCYSVLTNLILTKDDSMVRKLIDDAFSTTFITPGLVTSMDCSFMQEIAEYPLILVYLCLWHYRLTGDLVYLQANYPKITSLLDTYRNSYEQNGLLQDLDKWCVVEWPKNYQDGYDVDIREGKVCHQPHVSLNAYYIEAVATANKIAEIIGLPRYRDLQPLKDAFLKAFYSPEKQLFKDGRDTDHISLVGNIFPFAADLCPNDTCREKISNWVLSEKLHYVSFFCAFPALVGLIRQGKEDVLSDLLADEEAWLRILREDGTTTFEGWGKDTKWNTSLFHMTLSYAAVFLADIDAEALFE